MHAVFAMMALMASLAACSGRLSEGGAGDVPCDLVIAVWSKVVCPGAVDEQDWP